MNNHQIKVRSLIFFFVITIFAAVLFTESHTVQAAGNAVVKCGEKTYETLNAALDSAESGATILFLKDVEIEPESLNMTKDIIFDLNGHTLSAINPEQGHLHYLLTQTSGKLFIRNGRLGGKQMMGISTTGKSVLTLENVAINMTGRTLNIRDHARVTVDHDCKLVTNGDDSTIMIISQYDGLDWGKRPELDVYGTVVSLTEKPAVSGSSHDSGKTHVHLGDGAVIQSEGTAVFQPQNGTLVIDGANVNGRSGIEVRQGTLKINDGAEITGFDASGTGFVSDPESLDPCTNSAALIIAEKPRKGQIRAYINGGFFKGDAALCSLKLQDTATTRLTHQAKKAKEPVKAYIRVEDGVFDGMISDTAECCYGIARNGQFKTDPAWQVKGSPLRIYEHTGKNDGWFYVGGDAQKRLEDAAPGTKIDLLNCGELNNVKAGLVLVNKQAWDVNVNGRQTVTNGRSIKVE